MPKENQSSDELLSSVVAQRTEEIKDQISRIDFRFKLFEAKLKKLSEIQERKRINMAEEFVMAKDEINSTSIEIQNLQEEIRKALEGKKLSEEQIKKLETRLNSLQVLLPSTDTELN